MSDTQDGVVFCIVTVEEAVTNKLVDDILSCAFEGGINYWCSKAEPDGAWPEGARWASDCITKGVNIRLYDGEEEVIHILTPEKMAKGFQVWCKLMGKTIGSLYEDYDAGDADNIVQCALFGEIIYG